MSDKQPTLEDLLKSLDAHQHEQRKQWHLFDTRMLNAESSIAAIESELVTRDEILELVQDSLAEFAQSVPEIVRRAVQTANRESQQVSEENQRLIAEIKRELNTVEKATMPIVEIYQGMRFIRVFLLGTASTVVALTAIVGGVLYLTGAI